MNVTMKHCISYSLSLAFDFPKLVTAFQSKYKSHVHKDVIHCYDGEWDVFLFDVGVVIFWNVSYDLQKLIIDQTIPFQEHPLKNHHEEVFSYILHPQLNESKFVNDVLVLTTEDYLQKLSLSFALAQSVDLSSFEEIIQQLIDKTDYIPDTLKAKGTINLSAKEISKLRGEILEMKGFVNFHFNLLDIPEFFWEFPQLEHSYVGAAKYLEIQRRVDIFNRKLGMLEELLDVLGDEQKHNHSSKLEWIIIILIVIEICFTLEEKFGHFFYK
jgi:uncharacterized Rmd1/YagE family protein